MLRTTILLCAVILVIDPTYSQQTITGNMGFLLNEEIENIPLEFSNKYVPPTENQLLLWEEVIDLIASEDFLNIDSKLSELEYEFLEVFDNSSGVEIVYYLLRKTDEGFNYWGTYAFNFNGACHIPIVIQAPHPIADMNTGSQAVFSFLETGAHALFVNGTHRCNSDIVSSCSGTSSVCTGSSEPYTISDVAHNADSPFQVSTEVLADKNEEAVFVQLHGFSKRDSDPYVIISNGTKEMPSLDDYVVSLKNNLSRADGFLTFEVGHLNQDWTRLLGTTNTQGRYLNGSANPCNSVATEATGKFIHIEQEFTKLREEEAGWQTMVLGLARTFDCPYEVVSGIEDRKQEPMVYPNPFKDELYLDFANMAGTFFTIKDITGTTVSKQEVLQSKRIDVSKLTQNGVYFYSLSGSNENLYTGKIIKSNK